MHIYFVGIGGTGVGPLALIASEAGYDVSGSDAKPSEYTKYISSKGLRVELDQSGDAIKDLHAEKPIDWVIGVSAITRLNPDHPELVFARENGIKITERDAFLNTILKEKNLKMIAAAGTHGKTTTTAMFVWTLLELGVPISYSVGAKMNFADMGHYDPASEYFVYECDEFHRNFLHFNPILSVISGVTWDHHEVFPTRQDYKDAFIQFVDQTNKTIIWDNDAEYLGVATSTSIQVLPSTDPNIESIELAGLYNRRDAWLVVEAVSKITSHPKSEIKKIIDKFPGTSRRMEEISPGLFSDYAHTPEKIVGGLSVALELAEKRNKSVVVVYEPLTNRRQHFMKDDYKDCFKGAKKVYWVPSYLAREDPKQPMLTPEDLISYLANPGVAEAANPDQKLWDDITIDLQDSIVVCMSGGGGGNSLDEWARVQVRNQ